MSKISNKCWILKIRFIFFFSSPESEFNQSLTILTSACHGLEKSEETPMICFTPLHTNNGRMIPVSLSAQSGRPNHNRATPTSPQWLSDFMDSSLVTEAGEEKRLMRRLLAMGVMASTSAISAETAWPWAVFWGVEELVPSLLTVETENHCHCFGRLPSNPHTS